MIPPSPQKRSGSRSSCLAWLRSPTSLAVGALLAVTLSFYHGLWLPDLVLIKRDAYRHFPQIKHFAIERFSAGELPQWFPYEGLGHPFIGAAHAGVFHPLTALYFFLLPSDAFRAAALISCLLAALGAFVLGRTLGFTRAGALLAGIAFTLSGYIVSLTENPVYLYSICALPLFCAVLEKALNDGRAWAMVPAAVWATVLLNGDVQTGYYYIFVALAWTAARAPGSYPEAWLRLALVGGLAALLAGIQLGPTWTVFVGSDRAQPTRFLEQALAWSTHPLRLATLLVSPVGEQEDPTVLARVFFGTPIGGFFAESFYLGVPVMGLALLGVRHRRDLRVFALLGALALLLALGRFGGFYVLLYHVLPLWSAFRHPEKLIMVVFFVVSMLAGAGLDALRTGKGRISPWLVTALLCVGASFALRTETASVWVAASFGAPETLAHAVTASVGHAFLFSAAAALGVGLIIFVSRQQLVHEKVALLLLVILITLDLARANLSAYHTGPAEAATFVPPLAAAMQAREGASVTGRFRYISIPEPTVVWPKALMDQLGYYGASSVERRQALDLEHNAEFHLETVFPYLPGFNARLLATLDPRTGIEAAARLNVTYYIGRRYHLKDPRFAQAFVAELPPYDLALFRNSVAAKPRVYLSLRPERATKPVDPMALYTRSDFLSGDVDVIETADETLLEPAIGGLATIEHYAPEDVRVRVEIPRPAVLILLDAFDTGWQATLESGVEIPILRANVLVRAVVMPAGSHVVTFRYRTPFLQAGVWVSLLGCATCLALIARARRGRRPRLSLT